MVTTGRHYNVKFLHDVSWFITDPVIADLTECAAMKLPYS